MAKRWKKHRLTIIPETKDYDMIEHTITKYTPPAPVSHFQRNETRGALTHSGLREWPKARYDNYLRQLSNKGFTIGARARTKYGFLVTVEALMEAPLTGDVVQFYGRETPCCIQVRRDDANYVISYGEDELTLQAL